MCYTKPIILLVGKSGSGKTAVATYLENQYGLKQLSSYTTRAKRTKNEIGHIFITKSEYDTLEDKVATTYFDGNYYCATAQQVADNDIYVIDPDGVLEFVKKYKGSKPYVVVYLDIPWWVRFFRMTIKRKDGIWNAIKRIDNDYIKFGGFNDTTYRVSSVYQKGTIKEIGDSIYFDFWSFQEKEKNNA